MVRGNEISNSLTPDEIMRTFDGTKWSESFPPVLSVTQAAELAQVPKGTIYDWSSRGELRACSAKKGKKLRIWRDRFVAYLFEEFDKEGGRRNAIQSG